MTLLHTNTRKFGEPYVYEAVHNPAVLRTGPIKDCAWTNAQNRTRHTHARMDIHTESHMHTHARMDMHRIAHAHTHARMDMHSENRTASSTETSLSMFSYVGCKSMLLLIAACTARAAIAMFFSVSALNAKV